LPSPGRSLLGYLDDKSALVYLNNVCVGEPVGAATLDLRLRDCRERLGACPVTAGRPTIELLPSRFLPPILARLHEIKARAGIWQGTVRSALVEIGPLLAFQISVSTPVVNRYLAILGRSFALEDLVDLCLPTSPASAQVNAVITRGDRCLTMRSEGPDLRVAESGVFENGRVLGIELGTSTGLVEVADVGGVYVLTNGYHRACALQAAGVTTMPCVVWECGSFEEAGFRLNGTTLPLGDEGRRPTVGQYVEDYSAQVILRRVRREITMWWRERMVIDDD